MKAKHKDVIKYYHGDDESIKDFLLSPDLYDFNEFDALRKFTGTHPKVMKDRIAAKNWTISLDITKKKMKLKDKILYYFEKLTNIRLFAFKNYKLIK